MPRYQILVEYAGSNFRGWQVQKKGKTVQGLIQEKISKLLKEKKTEGRGGKKPQKIGEYMLGSHIRKGALLTNA